MIKKKKFKFSQLLLILNEKIQFKNNIYIYISFFFLKKKKKKKKKKKILKKKNLKIKKKN